MNDHRSFGGDAGENRTRLTGPPTTNLRPSRRRFALACVALAADGCHTPPGTRFAAKGVQCKKAEAHVRELAKYLLQHVYIDFQGAITVDQVRQFLREDDSREARALLSKLIEDRGVDDFMVTIADCLKEYIRTGINEEVVREQLTIYGQS